ncbi:MAG TPA: hypothetical protein VNO14_10440 [Blastocatellia bacterium]|nr:hypothetical protein [Blastocatellia bacterium]
MLKISRSERSGEGETLRLYGRMIDPWVGEVRKAVEQLLDVGERVTLDLDEVSFVDRDGVALLREMVDRQVALINCSPFLTERLKEASKDRQPETREGARRVSQ